MTGQRTGPGSILPDLTGWLDLPNGRLRYEVSGNPSRPPVVLVHGFSFDQTLWDLQVPVLAQPYRVIRYDLRGSGRSSAPSADTSHLDDLLSLLDAAGLASAHLVGMSLGGNIALAAAVRYPGRVRSLTLISSGLPGHDWRTPRPPDVVRAVAAEQGREAAKLRWLEHPMFVVASRDPCTAARLRQMVAAFPAIPWSAEGTDAAPLPNVAESLAAIEVPTLVISGGLDDQGYREIAGRLVSEVRGSSHLEFADADHLVNLEVADEVNAALLEFLGAQDSPASRSDGNPESAI